MPTGEDQGLYSESNLVPVTVTYNAQDALNSSLTGQVSPVNGENQNKFVYYKYYPIKDGKIEIELMDAPFSLRPNGKGFAGWTTNYPGTTFKFDKDIYTRYAYVNVSGTTPISIEFKAMWKKANYSYGRSIDTSVFENYTMKVDRDKNYISDADKPNYPGYSLDFRTDLEYFERRVIYRYDVMGRGYRLLSSGTQANYVANSWTCNFDNFRNSRGE